MSAKSCAMTSSVRPAVHLGHGFVDQPRAESRPPSGGLVHHQHGRLLDQRARQAQALALAARQVAGALAQFGVVALRQVDDELVRAGRLRGGDLASCGASGRP
jgi:hypothetical protein